jgi:hypothetical protein
LGLVDDPEYKNSDQTLKLVPYTFVEASIALGRLPSMKKMKDVKPIFETEGRSLRFHVHPKGLSTFDVRNLPVAIAVRTFPFPPLAQHP